MAGASSSRPLSVLETGTALGREGLRVLARVARHGRVRRDPRRVAGEYDAGYWSSVLSDRRWERSATLDEFVAPPQTRERIAKIGHRLVRISDADYYRYRTDVLRATLTEWAPDTTVLAEFGCGYGANLFALAGQKRWTRLVGFDISAAGLEAGDQISRRFNLQDVVEFHRLDLLDGADPSFKEARGLTAFTYYCFEQLKHSTEAALRNIIASGVRRVIHIEATPELWKWWRPSDALSRLYAWSQDYQDNLLSTLRALEAQGQLRIVHVSRLGYAPGVRHDPTLICWEPPA